MAGIERGGQGLFRACGFTPCPVSNAGPLKIPKVSETVRQARLVEVRSEAMYSSSPGNRWCGRGPSGDGERGKGLLWGAESTGLGNQLKPRHTGEGKRALAAGTTSRTGLEMRWGGQWQIEDFWKRGGNSWSQVPERFKRK